MVFTIFIELCPTGIFQFMKTYLIITHSDGTEERIVVNSKHLVYRVQPGDNARMEDEEGATVSVVLEPEEEDLNLLLKEGTKVTLVDFYKQLGSGAPITVTLDESDLVDALEGFDREFDSQLGNIPDHDGFTLMRYSNTGYIDFGEQLKGLDDEEFGGARGGSSPSGGGSNPDPNSPPDALLDTATAGDRQVVNLNLLGNDSDPDGDFIFVRGINGQTITAGESVTLPSGAIVTLKSDGTVDYDPGDNFEYLDEGESATDRFTYTIVDPNGNIDIGTAQITLEGTDQPIDPDPDQESVDEGVPVTIDVLENDLDPDSSDNPLSITSVTQPPRGTVTNNGTDVTYDPGDEFDYLDPGESETVTFTYTAETPDGDPVTETVTVTINGTEDPTITEEDFGVTDEHTPVTVNVLTNDSDPDDVLTVTAVTDPPPGQGTVTHDGTNVTFDPGNDFDDLDDGETATVTVTYTVNTGVTETVTFTINGEEDPTVTNPDEETVDEDSTVTVSVLTNDSDPDENDNPLTVTNLTQPPAGQGSATTDGTKVTFDPGGDFQDLGEGESEIVTFTYDATTPDGETSTETVTITVKGTNDGPETVGTIVDQDNDDSDVVVSVDISGNFSDPDTTDVLTFTDGGSLPPGLTIDPNTGVISGTIEEDASTSGPYTVVITAEDPEGATVTQTFSWNVDNPEPIAVDDSYDVDEDDGSTVIGNVIPNDSDPDGDSLSTTPDSGPGSTGGTFSIDGVGDVTFDPGTDYNDLGEGESAITTFEYTLEDADGATDTATITVTVTGENDGPVAVGTIGDQGDDDSDVIVGVDVSSNFGDPDTTDILTFYGRR